MVISVDIPEEILEQAQSRGLTPEAYIASLIENQRPKPELPASQDERMARLEKFFEEISANSENIPRLPDEAFTRERFYRDHD
jgi:hypothetical protein